MDTQDIKEFRKRLALFAKELSNKRDELDSIIYEAQDLSESIDTALDDLSRARDALSQFV